MDKITNKPCVVKTPQGFSVSYNNHLLYSKYNPSKSIIQSIQNLQILPGSIILCNSPVLFLGIQELLDKLPDNSFVIFCEKNQDLYDFSLDYYTNSINRKNIIYFQPKDLFNLPVFIYNLSSKGIYKRVIRIDFSAGVQFNSGFYNQLETSCTNAIATFWKNRITLTKFGRKYSQNLFRNLKVLAKTTPITNYFHKINKPILVFGAGQSLDLFFKNNSIDFKNFYILCADTALLPLVKRNIIPDGTFIEEAQSVISKAFIGSCKTTHLFAGLSSLPNVARYFHPSDISYFTTEYASTQFIDNLKETSFLPYVNKPFGSVGLTAVYYALKFRKDNCIPIYTAGLDFSYRLGFTHAKNTLAHISRLLGTTKLIPVENYGAFCNPSAIPFSDKNGSRFVTTPSLQTYAQLFNNLFTGEKNLFDAGDCGYPLGIIRAKPLISSADISNDISQQGFSNEQATEIKAYLENEKKELIKLKDILTGKIHLSEKERKDEITKTAIQREYLFLHFPDGYCFTYSQSFLNRIRTEIDFFLKYL